MKSFMKVVNKIPIQNFEKRLDGLLKIDLNNLPLPLEQ